MGTKKGGSPVQFRTTLHQAKGKNATGIPVPESAIRQLDGGKRPSVRASINGFEYRTTVGVRGGQAMIPVSAAVREKAGVRAGDDIAVELVVDDTPRTVEVPDDFGAALQREGVRGFFDDLANSLQRYHVDLVTGAKAPETRQRRIDKAIGLFKSGKKR